MSGILIKKNIHTRTIAAKHEKYYQIPSSNYNNLYK